VDKLWASSRSGSHAGRGFHYQDAVATELAVRGLRGDLPLARVIPEGLEDVSLELDSYALHLQAKSRREHRGDFSAAALAEAWQHLAERASADAEAHVGLVLERPLAGVVTGLEQTLADVADETLTTTMTNAVSAILPTEDFLARAHVFVMPAAPATAIALLADHFGVPPATCLAHYEILRGRLVGLADENGEPHRSAAAPAALTVADIARLLDDVNEAVDPSLLDEALRSGAVELADFVTPINEPSFYTGVDVVPGHVVAGLPLQRDELVAELDDALDTRGVALAVGPSGAGKSALIWLTAFASRHRRRWYRVRRLGDDDVTALVRLVNALRPTGTEIGFVVDDLGRDDRSGFDRLVDELRHLPAAAVLGACREEDLFLVRSAAGTAQVRPALDEELAERIWRELQDTDETSWMEWREPFEKSDRLLLEYGHLLTEGTRLAETITAQVNRRVRERRDDELDLLALVATADAYGADLRAAQVRDTLGTEAAAIKAAMVRLVDEHLISEQDGVLSGLHELRSGHIARAIHAVPPPTFAATVQRVIELLETHVLQRFLTRLLLAGTVADDVVIDAVAARVVNRLDAQALAASLHALRLVGFRRKSPDWREILAAEGVAPTHVTLIAYLALRGGDTTILPEPIQRAVARLRALDMPDPRPSLVEKVAPQLNAVLAASDVDAATELLSALADQPVDVDPTAVAAVGSSVPLDQLRALLEAAYLVDRELAIAVVDALGGAHALLTRLQDERPWIRHAHLGTTPDGRAAAFADYAAVAESVQPDQHGDVVELAGFVLAFAPGAEIAICRAIDARGQLAGFGDYTIADKAIPRANLPSTAEVAWNRARGRAAAAAVAASSETDYLRAASDIIVAADRLVRRVGECWLRGQRPPRQLLAASEALAEGTNSLAPPPVAADSVDGDSDGEHRINDPVSFLGTMIANNLFPNLLRGERVAPLVPTLIEQLDKVANAEYWRLLGNPPLEELAQLREALVDLHAVAAEAARGERAAAAVRAAGRRGLAGAARVARRRADARMQAMTGRVEEELGKVGVPATVRRRPAAPQSHSWPSDAVLVLVEVPTIFVWLERVGEFADLCRPLLEDRVSFLMAPVRDGLVVASYGVDVITGVFPAAEKVLGWDVPLLDERLGDLVRRGFAGVDEASSIVASLAGDVIHDDEAAALRAASGRANEAYEELDALPGTTNGQLLIEVEATLVGAIRAFDAELDAAAAGAPVARSIAATMIDGLNGVHSDEFLARIAAAAACAEWDANADGAWDRVRDGLELPGDD